MPKVSIIVPNYNHKNYLEERLDTIFNQTFQDFEVILLDDASNDGSERLIKKYQNHSKVSHLIINEVNSGSPFKQWKKGIGLAKGSWIWIAESDDLSELSFLEEALTSTSEKVGMVATAIRLQHEIDETSEVFSPFQTGVFSGKEIIEKAMLRGNSIRNGSSVLFKKQLLDHSVIEALDQFRICGDWWLWLNILRRFDLYFIDRPLTTYRKHEGAVTYGLSNNPLFYKEVYKLLKELNSWEDISREGFSNALEFWKQKMLKSQINAEIKIELIKNFTAMAAVPDRINKNVKRTTMSLKNSVLGKINRLFHHYLKRKEENKDLYLIYTMGKVGSASVYHSLKEMFPNKKVLHVHFLGDTWLNKFKTDHEVFSNNIRNAERIYSLMKLKKWNIKIITLTRDPIARDVSGIFQTWQHIFNEQNIENVSVESIVSHLNESDFTYPQEWFETDFIEFTGINVFDQNFSFDAENGYSIYKQGNYPLAIIQLEKLDSVYSQAMNEFLGPGRYQLNKSNITEERTSGELNRSVKQKFRITAEKAKRIYDSKYCHTFYRPNQIQKFYERWTE